VKPFFKWSGGKSRELSKILKHAPDSYDKYYEPFIGGGALWLHLNPDSSVINDSYPEVINFYNIMAEDPHRLIGHLNSISQDYNNSPKETKQEMEKLAEKFYYHYRDNDFKTKFEQAVKFYILRQLSFSGMLRFNKDGKYNVPYGWYKKMKMLPHSAESVSDVFAKTKLLCGDWKAGVQGATENDFAFLDPPYTRKFQKYHPNGEFSQQEHIELSNWFKDKHSKALIIINRDDFTVSLYKDFLVEEYDFNYSIQFRDRMTKEDTSSKHILAKNYED
jgi:DNA adenine methylase